jgi:DNA-binding NarL/FixJ family response regulator
MRIPRDGEPRLTPVLGSRAAALGTDERGANREGEEPMTTRPVRLVLANDDHIIVEGLRSMLQPYDHRVVVVATALGDPEIEFAVESRDDADVMLIDAFSRTAGGIDAAAKVMAQDPPFAVAVFTDADDLRLMLQALRIGVQGYLLKSATPGDLADMIVRLHAGETVVDPRLAIEAALLAARAIDLGEWPGAHLGLTRREAELLVLLAQGLNPGAAARELGVTSETVRTHTRNIYRKLGVGDRAAAVTVAWREGLVN